MALKLFLIIGMLVPTIVCKPGWPAPPFKPPPFASKVVNTASGAGTRMGVDMSALSDMSCRHGFHSYPGDVYSTAAAECKSTHQGVEATRECTSTCVWNKLKFVDAATGKMKRPELEAQLRVLFPQEESSVKTYADDFEFCFNETKPQVVDDHNGCKANIPYTKCFRERTQKSCGGAPIVFGTPSAENSAASNATSAIAHLATAAIAQPAPAAIAQPAPSASAQPAPAESAQPATAAAAASN